MRRYGGDGSGACRTQSPLQNPEKRILEPEGPNDFAHRGYKVLKRAERGEPRELLSEPLGYDEGPYHSMDYPDR